MQASLVPACQATPVRCSRITKFSSSNLGKPAVRAVVRSAEATQQDSQALQAQEVLQDAEPNAISPADGATQDSQPLQAQGVLPEAESSALLPADEAIQDSQSLQAQEALQEAEPNALSPADAPITQSQVSQPLPPGQQQITLRLQIVPSIKEVKQSDWDACALGSGEMNPFLLWSFLNALEESKSAVKEEGWVPQHVCLYDDSTSEMMGCVPLYLKSHSYGEYVFDHSWASTHMRCGLPYYPKLQSCVPFTPVTGNRLLVKPGPNAAAVRKALAKGLLEVTDQYGVSSLHLTFSTAEEASTLAEVGYLQRRGIQYHWENRGYNTFDDFLMDLKQSKRKNIRQERKSVANAGLNVKRLTGEDIKPEHWEAFYLAYINTTDRKWGQAYLTQDFFPCLGKAMADKVLLVMAEDASTNKPVAAALNLIGSDALFGRNWGCMYGSSIKHLHFELCYYQAIEFAIERGLSRVEAGAQGEHKIQRGYLPSLTYSCHYVRDKHVSEAIADYLRREQWQINYQLEALTTQESPFKQPAAAIV